MGLVRLIRDTDVILGKIEEDVETEGETDMPCGALEMEDVAPRAASGLPRPGLVPVSIIGAEDEDFENELEAPSEEQSSQFQNVEQVKRRPAHLMALLQHVALQFEPAPLSNICDSTLPADPGGGPNSAFLAGITRQDSGLVSGGKLLVISDLDDTQALIQKRNHPKQPVIKWTRCNY
ncbi:Rho guanine nucleotide exchange factor 1 [Fukomys damarensis]|uniref:Rho guanine nucleotide exchange factor 1 n=1 Tax=Fukomys damarensis TaxID=885580 RepID=A0A091DNC0_FUKDA|nr:Rho guanine nucleotide exchange factor 1 [Fukomys damarensis]